MIAAERVAVVLLAAGLSRRFGAADKLSAPLHGLPLGLHAARTLSALPFAARIAVTGATPPDYAGYGFEIVTNHDPAAGQARSLRLGVAAAERTGCDAILVALADMPFVSRGHIEALLASHRGPASIIASDAGAAPMPPALFGGDWLPRLIGLDGDRGARTLLKGAPCVNADWRELADVDAPADLEAIEGLSRRSG